MDSHSKLTAQLSIGYPPITRDSGLFPERGIELYVYIAGWNSPGCLPDNPPSAFDNEKAARDYMRDVFRGNADHFGEDDPHNSIAAEFDQFADDMEFHGDAAMGNGDSYWSGPDGLNYFIECVDWTEEMWREYISGSE